MQVEVVNPLHSRADRYRFVIPATVSYEGTAVQLKHVSADCLALTTGQADWPIRVIPRSWIMSIDGQPYSWAVSTQVTRTVQGSRGQVYTVTVGARPSCTCTGFAFRGSCKHVKEFQNE